MEKKSLASGNKRAIYLACCDRKKTPSFSFLTAAGILAGLLSLALTFTFQGERKETSPQDVRKAAVAGGFYPANKTVLENYVDELLRQATPPTIQGPIRAIMVPHAGYIYSGPVAAYAYKELEGRDIRTVILIGNSHHHYFDGIAVYARGAFETPLGTVPVDQTFTANLLAADPAFVNRPDVHAEDHVLEVQIPFLQRVLKNKDFKIVPILFSGDSPELARKMSATLSKLLNDQTLIVASTDMSHYPPYDEASAADKETLDAILSGKMENLDATLQKLAAEHIPQAETFLCSPSGVRIAMLLGQSLGDPQPILLKYGNSGDTLAGDRKRVVGYGAVAFVSKESALPTMAPAIPNEKKKEMAEKGMAEAEKEELLKIARSTVESYIRTRKVPEFLPTSANLRQPLGAFVTLKENGRLRGCIGRFDPSGPLYLIVQQMALSAALNDPRFNPVSAEELGQLEYEISVLSPLRKVASADEIELGKHGVQVSKGFHRGVFLPQVATETGWSKAQFLSELCTQKAGLSADCWKDPDVTLQVFTADVFSEKQK